MDLWTSPSDRPAPCGPCGQPVGNAPGARCPPPAHTRGPLAHNSTGPTTNFFTCGLYNRNPGARSSPIDWPDITQVALDRRGFSPNHPVIAQTASDFNKTRRKTDFTITFSLDNASFAKSRLALDKGAFPWGRRREVPLKEELVFERVAQGVGENTRFLTLVRFLLLAPDDVELIFEHGAGRVEGIVRALAGPLRLDPCGKTFLFAHSKVLTVGIESVFFQFGPKRRNGAVH